MASFRPYEEHRIKFVSLRLVTAIVGVIAAADTSLIWFGNIDICGGASGRWIGTLLGSPLFFVGLCMCCAAVVPSDVEQSIWVAVAALLLLLYIPAAFVTLIAGGTGPTWC